MEVTANNIANVNTEGYTRQRVNLTEIGGPSPGPACTRRPRTVGDGVKIDKRRAAARRVPGEPRPRRARARTPTCRAQQQTLGRIEAAFAEPGDTALQAQLTEFWTAFSRRGEPARRPGHAHRADRARHDRRRHHPGHRPASSRRCGTPPTSSLGALVTEVNETAKTVAELNQAVVASQQQRPAGERPGRPARPRGHEARRAHRRAPRTTRPDGSVDVLLGGSLLVSGNTARQLLAPSGATTIGDARAAPPSTSGGPTGRTPRSPPRPASWRAVAGGAELDAAHTTPRGSTTWPVNLADDGQRQARAGPDRRRRAGRARTSGRARPGSR